MTHWRELPETFHTPLRRETEGEAIHWLGRSSGSRAFWTAAPGWLIAIPWLGFAIFWEVAIIGGLLFGNVDKKAGTFAETMGWVMALFGVPFVIIGIAMVLSPFWMAWKARRTVHVVTDKRVLSLTVGRQLKVVSVPCRQVRSIERTERRDGSGNLRLIYGTEKDSDGDTSRLTHDLFAVPEVRKAERAVMTVRQRAA